jgi:hypothetical protein
MHDRSRSGLHQNDGSALVKRAVVGDVESSAIAHAPSGTRTERSWRACPRTTGIIAARRVRYRRHSFATERGRKLFGRRYVSARLRRTAGMARSPPKRRAVEVGPLAQPWGDGGRRHGHRRLGAGWWKEGW